MVCLNYQPAQERHLRFWRSVLVTVRPVSKWGCHRVASSVSSIHSSRPSPDVAASCPSPRPGSRWPGQPDTRRWSCWSRLSNSATKVRIVEISTLKTNKQASSGRILQHEFSSDTRRFPENETPLQRRLVFKDFLQEKNDFEVRDTPIFFSQQKTEVRASVCGCVYASKYACVDVLKRKWRKVTSEKLWERKK